MATRNPSTGMAHLTVVPENFDPTAVDGPSPGDESDERTDAGDSDDGERAREE